PPPFTTTARNSDLQLAEDLATYAAELVRRAGYDGATDPRTFDREPIRKILVHIVEEHRAEWTGPGYLLDVPRCEHDAFVKAEAEAERRGQPFDATCRCLACIGAAAGVTKVRSAYNAQLTPKKNKPTPAPAATVQEPRQVATPKTVAPPTSRTES